MITEAMNLAVVRTELDRVFKQNFDYDDTTPSIATANTAALFKPMTIDRQAYIEEIYKGGGLFPKIGEVGIVPVSDIAVANKMITPVLDFADSRELSKNWFDDQLHNLWQHTIADMALKARITQDVNAFGIYRGAFTTTLTADGSALIGTHTLLNGQSYSNLVTGALSPSTLNDAIVKLRQQPDQAGIVLGNAAAYLVVPSKLFKHAIEITQSALTPDSANNNVNVYRSIYGLTVYSSPYLDSIAGFTSDGSDTAWFLLSKNHTITRIVRQGLQTFLRDWGYSNNRTYNYQANFRETVYCPDYIGVVGSTGL